MNKKRLQEFWEKQAILQERYIWRGMIGEDPNHLEKSTFKYFSDMVKLCKEYEDLFEDVN